jgi:hypothetical protein
MLFFALYFFAVPGCIISCNLRDPALKDGKIPRISWKLHRAITPKYEKWARERIESGKADKLSIHNVSGTEWPLFGSVFYLWATSSLQEAWEKDNSLSKIAPKEYACDAIEAAKDLVIDPASASWVRRMWGDDYLYQENAFFRMLVIAALTEHHNLTGEKKHIPMLRDQVETLSKEIDESKYGLLDDYPGQCYPADVVAAIACIRRADGILGTDHSDFVARSIRGFEGDLADEYGLVPYMANMWVGRVGIPSRGCGNSYVCWFAPEIWPECAKEWYNSYEEHFWQEKWTASGFREFPKELPGHNWGLGVDSGPILAGHGFAACAFGLGAARMNGRLDHAYPLAAEMLVTSWPLPHGTLAMPRVLSDLADAPYLGEAGILFNLTRTPPASAVLKTGGSIPVFVYIVLTLYFLQAALMIAYAAKSVRKWRKLEDARVPYEKAQFGIWLFFTLAGAAAFLFFSIWGLLVLLAAQVWPRTLKVKEAAAG